MQDNLIERINLRIPVLKQYLCDNKADLPDFDGICDECKTANNTEVDFGIIFSER